MTELGHLNRVEWFRGGDFMALDETAKRNLELFETMHDGKREGSLFKIIDDTITAMGGRRLRWWLNYPLLDEAKINERLAAVSEIKRKHVLRADLRGLFKKRLRYGKARGQGIHGDSQCQGPGRPSGILSRPCRLSRIRLESWSLRWAGKSWTR